MSASRFPRTKLAVALVVSIGLVVAGFGCSGSGTPTPSGEAVEANSASYRSVTPAELHNMLAHKDFLLVDVHSATGPRIQDDDLYVPYDNIQGNLSHLPADKAARIVVYCQSGYMSAIAAKSLVGLGYTNVLDLAGGMLDWQKQGYSLTEDAR